jgi:uncharacterized membrane protein
MLVVGIRSYVQDETELKLTFVRLIGRHDGVFLFVQYALFIMIFTLVDLFSTYDLRFALNLWYIPYALYAFAKLMDHKQSQSRVFFITSLVSVILFISIYLFTVTFHNKPFPERVFPLYRPPSIPVNETLAIPGNETLANQTMQNATLENILTNLTE